MLPAPAVGAALPLPNIKGGGLPELLLPAVAEVLVTVLALPPAAPKVKADVETVVPVAVAAGG